MLELLTGALTAGAVAGVTTAMAEAIKDAYTGLKSILIAKFGKTKGAIDVLEEDPSDEVAQQLVAKRIADAKAADDADVQAAADKLRATLKAANISVGAVNQTATGTGHTQVAGNNNTVTSNTSTGNSGINVQGSTVHGDVVQGVKVGRDKIDRQVNTGGGTYIEGGVTVSGDFVGRDQIVHNNYNTAPELSAIVTAEARALVPLLNQYFGLNDIDSLCFDMGIDDEQLRGQTKDEKARSLVKFIEQSGRMAELKAHMLAVRPNLRSQLA